MNPTVYISNQLIKPIISLLVPEWHIIEGWDTTSDIDKLKVSALATTVWDCIDELYLSQFPNLKLIAHLGIGTDNIDSEYLKKQHISLLS